MTEATHRHGLPLLQAGQAQKEVTHNEALVMLDLLAHPAVEDMQAVPPAAAQPGETWIVGANASGDWAGQDKALALWTPGGWRFAPAREGMLAWQKAAGVFAWFDGADWRTDGWQTAGQGDGQAGGQAVAAARGEAVTAPAGRATVDEEARAAIGKILTVLKSHGLIEA